MADYKISDKCHINTNIGEDTFVGVKCNNDLFTINFPLGFHISDNERDLRKDILLLLNSIAETTKKRDSTVSYDAKEFVDTGFPFQAYLFIISDYYERGYYKEREIRYQLSDTGKINWSRTIKSQKPYVKNNEVYYLNFVTRKNPIRDNEIITLIHEYCVYESFVKIGWLFTSKLPKKPRIKCNTKLFKSILANKLSETNNDKNWRLFQNMIAIIDGLSEVDSPINYLYGTYRFEYVWETIIDKVFGIDGKNVFFPKTSWKLNGNISENASLEPDTIMICGKNIYVLDAKYYKYSSTLNASDLPGTASINKQITYGEYVEQLSKEKWFTDKYGSEGNVFNAFLMPFDSAKWIQDDEWMCHVGEAISSWKTNKKTYERIQGILLDVKHLLDINLRHSETEIIKLAELISKSVEG